MNDLGALRIGIDGSRLSINQIAGVESYTFNLLKSLAKIDTKNTYTLYLKEKPNQTINDFLNSSSNFKCRVLPKTFSFTHFSLTKELFKSPVDVFFSANHTIPFIRPKKMKVVVMMHGVEHLTDRKLFDKFRFHTFMSLACKFADAVITPTHYVKDKLIDMGWGLQDTKITVIPEGVNTDIYTTQSKDAKITLGKYNLAKNQYIISICTIHPRKNIPRLVEAFSWVVSSSKSLGLKLVVVGKKGWDFEESLNSPSKYGVAKDVIFTGRIANDYLIDLLSNALVFVNPSIEEGFGLNILEAMACNTPIAVSDIPPFHEVVGDTGLYFDPKNSMSIKESIEKIVNDQSSAKDMAKKANERARLFTWENTASKTLAVFENIVKNS